MKIATRYRKVKRYTGLQDSGEREREREKKKFDEKKLYLFSEVA